MVDAPGRFSMTNGWPRCSESHCPISRAAMSVVPAGGAGTIRCTAASDRLALSQHVTPPAARPRTLPDGENIGGEVSFLNLPLASHHSFTSSSRIEIEAMFVYGR